MTCGYSVCNDTALIVLTSDCFELNTCPCSTCCPQKLFSSLFTHLAQVAKARDVGVNSIVLFPKVPDALKVLSYSKLCCHFYYYYPSMDESPYLVPLSQWRH